MLRERGGFNNSIKRGNLVSVNTLIRIYEEYEEEEALPEMLRILSNCIGNGCVMSVVNWETREVVATSEIEENRYFLEAVAQNVVYSEEKQDHQKFMTEGMYFRPGMSHIKIYPLKTKGKNLFFLMSELKSALCFYKDLDEEVAFLGLVVDNTLMKREIDRSKNFDRDFKIYVRDVIFRDFSREKTKYIAIFRLCTVGDIRYMINDFDLVLREMVGRIKTEYTDAYKLCLRSIGILDNESETKADAIRRAHRVLDFLMESLPSENIEVCIMPAENIREDVESDLSWVLSFMDECITGGNRGDTIFIPYPGPYDPYLDDELPYKEMYKEVIPNYYFNGESICLMRNFEEVRKEKYEWYEEEKGVFEDEPEPDPYEDMIKELEEETMRELEECLRS
ncbi:MAG: hypothetical protein K6F84_07855 [Lachnospiraceae bacterium]|nr:hypothetical protein [Lachnospiraceae bacterium]